jgi:hypothetical protein
MLGCTLGGVVIDAFSADCWHGCVAYQKGRSLSSLFSWGQYANAG